MARRYDPGTPTVARHIRDGIYAMDSFTGENVTYLLDINKLTCTCEHYIHKLAGTTGLCKHLKKLLLQETDTSIIEKARQCDAGSLDDLLQRYQSLDRPEVCRAILLVRQERRQLSDAQLKGIFR